MFNTHSSLSFSRLSLTLMEAFGILKFWRNAADDGGDEASFFDLVIKSPDGAAAGRGGGVAKKDLEFIESPTDFFPTKNLSPVTPLPSATKFKVFILGFRKLSKCEKTESNGELKGISPANPIPKCSKTAAASTLGRDDSLRSLLLKEASDCEASPENSPPEESVPKYLKLFKPLLHSKVWKRQNEKAKSTASSMTPSSTQAKARVHISPRNSSDGGGRAGGFKIVAKHLGKSRSAPSVIVAAPSIRRRDDLLMEQQDGIQSAVLYCKKSYNSSPGKEFSPLFRSSTDEASHVKLGQEPKRCSI
ncbi:hypothetical protein ACP275_06G105600 [Erythranthe tilingii]